MWRLSFQVLMSRSAFIYALTTRYGQRRVEQRTKRLRRRCESEWMKNGGSPATLIQKEAKKGNSATAEENNQNKFAIEKKANLLFVTFSARSSSAVLSTPVCSDNLACWSKQLPTLSGCRSIRKLPQLSLSLVFFFMFLDEARRKESNRRNYHWKTENQIRARDFCFVRYPLALSFPELPNSRIAESRNSRIAALQHSWIPEWRCRC